MSNKRVLWGTMLILICMLLSCLIRSGPPDFASPVEEAQDLLGRGNGYYVQSKYEEALERYNQALVIFKEQDDKEGQANAYFDIGNVYRAQGKYDLALESFDESLLIITENDLDVPKLERVLRKSIEYVKNNKN